MESARGASKSVSYHVPHVARFYRVHRSASCATSGPVGALRSPRTLPELVRRHCQGSEERRWADPPIACKGMPGVCGVPTGWSATPASDPIPASASSTLREVPWAIVQQDKRFPSTHDVPCDVAFRGWLSSPASDARPMPPPASQESLYRPFQVPRRRVLYSRLSRYPVLSTVRMWRGFAGSASSLRRSSATCVSTVRLMTESS